MRSNERAGIVSVVMLFLWGTLLTEPFHIFADYIAGAARLSVKGLGGNDILCSLAEFAVLLIVMLFMQKLINTKVETFIPCVIAIVSSLAFCLKSVTDGRLDLKKGIFLAIALVVVMLFYIIKSESLLKWAAAVYTYSISTALLNSLVFVPLAKMNGVLGKILYITRYNGVHISGAFAGIAGLPELVWGLFFAIFAALPIIFFAMQKGKA